MKSINALSDIDFVHNEQIQFEATVLEITAEGNKENKVPFRASIKLEGSGERVQVVSWNFDVLDLYIAAVDTLDILSMEGVGGIFRDAKQIRIGKTENTNKQSDKKILKVVDIAGIKRDFNAILNKYITTKFIRDMLDALVTNSEDFFIWPAATKIHHAYKGGLAVHTLQVINHSIALWKNYQGRNLDIEVLVAGAMLHDIGKLSEYNVDGSRTVFGNLVSHLVDGAERVTDYCANMGVDANNDSKILIIKHIILSHHEKLEYGSPNRPATLEAVIVAKADSLDATIEGIYKELDNTEPNEFTDRVYSADGNKFIKW